MTFEDVAQKFRMCAALGLPDWDGAEVVIDAVRRFEALDDSGALARLCLVQPAPVAGVVRQSQLAT